MGARQWEISISTNQTHLQRRFDRHKKALDKLVSQLNSIKEENAKSHSDYKSAVAIIDRLKLKNAELQQKCEALQLDHEIMQQEATDESIEVSFKDDKGCFDPDFELVAM